MAFLKSIAAFATCAAAIVDAAALLPRANSTKKLVTSVSTLCVVGHLTAYRSQRKL